MQAFSASGEAENYCRSALNDIVDLSYLGLSCIYIQLLEDRDQGSAKFVERFFRLPHICHRETRSCAISHVIEPSRRHSRACSLKRVDSFVVVGGSHTLRMKSHHEC